MRYAAVWDAADPDLSVYMNWHRVCVPLRMSTVALPLTMYRPRPLQRCSTTLLFLLTSLTWGLLCVWLGAWHRELDPPRFVSPSRIGTALVPILELETLTQARRHAAPAQPCTSCWFSQCCT